MIHTDLEKAFLQGDPAQASEIFNQLLRKFVRQGLFAAIEEEVNALCGPKYQPDPDSPYHRAGSEKGSAYLNGERETITRARVRHDTEGEVKLATYTAASRQRNFFDDVVSAVGQGLSSRGIERHTKGAVSKSAASRMWVEKSMEQLEIFRSRALDHLDLLAIQIDGVWVGEICIVIAVGIAADGSKHALDFEQGSSESKAVVTALIERLAKRGIEEREDRRLLVIRDGSSAIESAVRSHWPEAIQQECLIHQERNVIDKLRKRDKAETIGYFKRLREAQGKEAGEEAFDDLLDFVSERNATAGIALENRRSALLSVHHLNIPSTLNVTLLNTNIIENTIRNWREATHNVKLWSEKKEMISRWAASGLLWAEAGYRKVRGYKDLPKLSAALVKHGATRPTPPQADVSLTTPAPSEKEPQSSLKSESK